MSAVPFCLGTEISRYRKNWDRTVRDACIWDATVLPPYFSYFRCIDIHFPLTHLTDRKCPREVAYAYVISQLRSIPDDRIASEFSNPNLNKTLLWKYMADKIQIIE